MSDKPIFYICNACDHKITDPVYSYMKDGKIIDSRMEEFVNLDYIHAANSNIHCDKCGSDDLHDPDTKENLIKQSI